MPVNSTHPDYDKMLPEWQLMRAVAAGQRAIHKGGEKYLPRLNGETEPDFEARIRRTPFFAATWRTVEGLRGMLMRKEPGVKVSTAAQPMLADITKSGVDLNALALKAVEEVLTVGRVGLLEDHAPRPEMPGGREPSVAEVQAMNLRPHMALYVAESVINWRVEWKGNAAVLTLVTLQESAEIIDAKDRFKRDKEDRFRVLELDENGEYCMTVYRIAANGVEEPVGGTIYPTRNGARLRKIPFQIIGPDDLTPDIDLPPLLDLANLNISHYQTTADLEHGAHRTALPQPWISGLTAKYDAAGREIPITLYMGGGTAWTLPNGAQAGMLEYTGQGLASLEKRIEVKERQMAILGARMLEQQKTGVEAAETAGIHRSGEQSVLASIGATISKAFQIALTEFDLWAGGDGVVEFKLNDEFFPATMSAQDVLAAVQAWQSGAMSPQELFEKMQKGGWVRDGKTYEDHEAEVANNPPPLASAPEPAEEIEE